MQAVFAAALSAVLLVACAAPSGPAPVAREQVQFIDLAGFDQDLSASLAAPLPRVEVGFYDKVPPSKLPDRLQKWMAAIETNGGKVKVTPPPSSVTARSPLMLVSAITTLWSGYKMMREAEAEARFKAAAGHDAEIVLRQDGGEVLLDKVVFTRRPV